MKNKELENEEVSIAEETMQMCKILYCQKDLPMTKTCMCWGWECSKGWHDIIRRLSCELEALNILFYDKYKVRIQADQVKEKFGTLHFYYSVACDNFNDIGIEANKIIDAFETKKDLGYFGLKNICDKEAFYTEEKDDTDGKLHKVWHPAKYHIEATLHIDEYVQMKKEADEAYERLVASGRYELTPEQQVIIEYLDSEADKRIHQAEHDCYNVCERCGMSIGTDYSPRCETTGWITYICENCAKKVDKAGRCTTYFKDGAKYEGSKLLMTKEEVKAEHEAYEKKFKEKYADYDEPDNEGEEDAVKTQEKFTNEIMEAINEGKK